MGVFTNPYAAHRDRIDNIMGRVELVFQGDHLSYEIQGGDPGAAAQLTQRSALAAEQASQRQIVEDQARRVGTVLLYS